MNSGWLLLIALVVVAVGWFLAGVLRGIVRTSRAESRQDLIKLGGISETAKGLTDRSGVPTYAFIAPFAPGRSHPFGWLWWRVEPDIDGPPRQGWALTYRRARKAAGLPLSIRAQHSEIVLAAGHERQAVDD
ncbi:hypothetical protein ACGFYZ_40295 [Streptomyces sp. NPDC048330]|uniref:hypothetical protein n=1 Tax=Streptomyces sp. NPDC048330 TaxID=3365533 RepID=UPI003714A700